MEGGEDVFRFNLVPEVGSDLLRVTNSILKTRSTLSLYKVQKYLIKKLNEVYAESGCTDDQSVILLTCNGRQLEPSL